MLSKQTLQDLRDAARGYTADEAFAPTVFSRFLSDARETARREQPVLDALAAQSTTERIMGYVDEPLPWEGSD